MADKEKLIKDRQQKGSPKSKLNKWVILTVGVLLAAVVTALISPYEPTEYSLPPGPQFTGALAPNTKLQGAELLLKDQVKGPESLIVEDGTIYAAVEDGRILKVVDGKIVKEVILVKNKECQAPEFRMDNTDKCGRPLGLRRLTKNLLICTDAYLGIITIDVEKDKVDVILEGDALVEGTRMHFADDLDLLDENTILFSDASTKYRSKTCPYNHIESQPTGR
uniref:Adipocyte plasma membrane-associated protein n=1 Tax=Acrobeloides nanus TaxID=290746 RepID=A0A914CLN5_9BILA